MTRMFGSAHAGCYVLAAAIFSLGLLRDWLFKLAVDAQPTLQLDEFIAEPVRLIGYAMFAWGSVLVVTSMYRLGVTGTYLGDYFGILMQARVTGFPFSIARDPMYDGSTLCFLAQALRALSPSGVALSLLVYLVYQAAEAYEAPFTAMIYAARDAQKKM